MKASFGARIQIHTEYSLQNDFHRNSSDNRGSSSGGESEDTLSQKRRRGKISRYQVPYPPRNGWTSGRKPICVYPTIRLREAHNWRIPTAK